MSIVLFGPPGAGKGTQSERMVKEGKKTHISTGDLFRAAMKNKTPLGIEAKGYVDNGQLVPDSITIGLVREVLDANKEGDFIFDGFPRTSPQAEALEELISEMGVSPIQHALFLEVPKQVLMERLTGRRLCKDCGAVYHVKSAPTAKEGICDRCGGETYQRKDDSEDVIATRLEAYAKSTEPLKEYYQQKGLYIEIDGLGDTDSVFSRIKPYL
ncbi:MAG: adenylate kinase [Bdellovibrionales bacterium]|nr:adenylate kinase [Bdellovibrionales bacterium]